MDYQPLHMKLMNGWQRGFPLVPRPFASIADELAMSEAGVIRALEAMLRDGILSRIGAVVRPNTAGASTLAAMKIPPADLERVAAIVNAEPGVNHNYERDHEYNLWFVATAGDRREIGELLGRVSRASGYEILDLSLTRAHHIDLGFTLGEGRCLHQSVNEKPRQPHGLTVLAKDSVRINDSVRANDPVSQYSSAGKNVSVKLSDRRLLAALENGLPRVSRPFQELSAGLAVDEPEVILSLERLVFEGIISRFGLVVRHRKMGFTANAMAVWNVGENHVDEVGEQFAARSFVTLCYQRRRSPPHWPFNLYCMIHGREKNTVLSQIAQLNELVGSHSRAHTVLFSKRCFKQRGARFTTGHKTAPNPNRPGEATAQKEVHHA